MENMRGHYRGRRRGTQLMELPVDTLLDILLRLPVKEVGCVKCVSKTLSKMVSDISFSTLHARLWPAADQVPRLVYCSRNNNLLTLQSLKYKENTLTKGRYSTTISSSTPAASVRFVFQNIFCLRFRGTEDCMLMNVLGEKGVLRLPECSFSREKNTGIESMSWFGMGFDDKTNTYKIVCVTHDTDVDRRHTSMTAHVLVLGTNSWRQTTSLPPCEVNWRRAGDVVCANGAAHWLLPEPERDVDRIVSFDFRKEEFCWTPTPTFQSSNEPDFGWNSKMALFTLRGRLAILKSKLSDWSIFDIEIWVLKDFDEEEKLWEIYCSKKISDWFGLQFDPAVREWEHGIHIYKFWLPSDVFLVDVRLLKGPIGVYPVRHVTIPEEASAVTLGTYSYYDSLISLKDYGDLEDAHQLIT